MEREEAIKKVRWGLLGLVIDKDVRDAFETLIPELRESEDERIRKALVWHLKADADFVSNGVTKAECIAYLEKQKEQEPIKTEVCEVGNGTTVYGQDYKCKKDYKEGDCWFIKDVIYHCGMDGYLTDQNGISWYCTPKWFNEYIYTNNELADKEKNDFVSGQFLQCKLSFDDFKKGEHYWLEYVGDDTYVGRSDNILNQRFHITPRQLFTLFSQQLEKVQGPPQEEKQVSLNYEQPFNENPSNKEIIEALIKHLKEQDGFLTAIDCVSTKAILTWLEKQKEQKPLSTEETELNSIAFLEQMGYTCIPPKKEHQNNSDAPKNALGGALNSPLDKDKNLDDIAQDYVEAVKEYNPEPTWNLMLTAVCYGYHLAEQKEQKEIPLMNGDADLYFDNWIQHNDTTKRGCFEEGIRYAQRLQKEQKPADLSDMMVHKEPYIAPVPIPMVADEQKPAAEEKMENDKRFLSVCQHLETLIAESKNDEAKENIDKDYRWLCKFYREVSFCIYKKPAGWSEEDEKMRNLAIEWAETMSGQFRFVNMDSTDFRKIVTWLKSLRPSWRPSKEQMNLLLNIEGILRERLQYVKATQLAELYEQLKKLM